MVRFFILPGVAISSRTQRERGKAASFRLGPDRLLHGTTRAIIDATTASIFVVTGDISLAIFRKAPSNSTRPQFSQEEVGLADAGTISPVDALARFVVNCWQIRAKQ